jgi:hypothetical protein
MVDLYTIVGAGVFVGLKFLLSWLLKEQGLPRIIITLIIGFGMLAGATFIAPTCAAAATILVIGAIVFGGLPVVIMFMFVGGIPFIGEALVTVIGPISPLLWTILIISIVEFVVNMLGVFEIIPGIGTVIWILSLVIPIAEILILLAVFSGAFTDIATCFSTASSLEQRVLGVSLGT